MSRTEEATKNYIIITISEIVVLLMGFWCRALFVQKIGNYFLGINGILTSVFQILALSNLGLGDAIAYSLIQAYARKNENKIIGIYNYSKKIYKGIIVILIVFSIMIAFVLPFLVNGVVDFTKFYVYYAIFIASKIVTYYAGPYSTVLRADQKIRIMKKGELLGYVITTLLQIIFMYIYPSYAVYLFLAFLASVISNMYVRYEFRKNYNWILKQKYDIEIEDKKIIIKRMKDVFISRLSSAAVDSTDNILISKFIGLELVGIYSNYNMIIANIRSLAKNLYSSMESSLGNINALSSKEEIKQLYHKILLGFQIIAVIFVTCIFVLIQEFISIWIGENYLLPTSVLVVLAVDLYINIILYAQTCFINTTDLFAEVKTVYFWGAVINVVLSIILGWKMGLLGILLGTILSRALCNFPVGLFLLCKKQMDVNWVKELGLCIFYMMQMLFVVCVTYVIFKRFYVTNIFLWIVKGGLVFAVAAGCILIMNFKNSNINFYKDKIIYMIKRIKG